MSELEVTPAMLEAGYNEAVKVAEEEGLSWALHIYPKEKVQRILKEGFKIMYAEFINPGKMVKNAEGVYVWEKGVPKSK